MRSGVLGIVLALSVMLVPGRVAAQTESVPQRDKVDVLSANPFLLIAAWFNVEWEHQYSPTGTAGVRVSRVDIDNDAYFSGRAFWRYYPNGAFEGFYFGLDGGVTDLKESDTHHTVMGLGFELGYDWLLGDQRTFYVSLGAGADRLFGGDLGGASTVMPTVRLVNIGVRF